ncbi:hypothetical protein ACJIZ3_020006 [Penstemon smallii]|uniref:X8 domain-containing protein n=1 Tax=Penstemon smallii TaxID=265156 RepID=A0ABD3SHN8_9LAMI
MAVLVVGLVVLLAMAAHSDATYCACNTGLSDTVLQRNIDYACGAGADCSAILQNGACYNPNTVRDHCNYAVNSYYQRRGQVTGSCDFSGTAAVTQTAPSNAASGCVTGGPNTGGTPNTGTGGTGNFPGSTVPPGGGGIGLAPTGSGFDNSAGLTLLSLSTTIMLMFFSLTLLLSGFK